MMPGVFAGGAAAGGGGGAGLAPNAIGAGANLTFWLDADSSSLYQTASDASPATANGDTVSRMDSANSIARTFYNSLAGDLLVPGINGNKAIRFHPGIATDLYTKPASGSAVSATQNMSSLITTTEAVIIFAGKIDNGPANSGNPYGNPALLDCATQNMGLHFYKSGSNAILQAYNWDGDADVVTATVPLGTPFVVVYKHAAGQLRIGLNGTTYSSTASGACAGISNVARLHGNVNAADDLSYAQLATYNIDVADADILEVMRWMGAKVGVTI